MQIQVDTDNNITGRQELVARVTSEIESALERFSGQITRVQVHLTDENAAKQGARDKRCVVEARLEGLHPIAATHQAETLDQALGGAVEQVGRAIESTIGRLRDRT